MTESRRLGFPSISERRDVVIHPYVRLNHDDGAISV